MPLFRKKKKPDDEPADPEERSPLTGVKFKDLAVLGQLMKSGADLYQPRDVLHYLYFPNKKAATTVGNAARKLGFEAQVNEPLPQYPDNWRLLAQNRSLVLSLDVVREHGNFFDELAATHGGDYDGWEASV